MKHYRVSYFIGQAFQGLWRNGVMSFASIMVLMSCLVVIGSFTLLVLNIDMNLSELGLMNEIVVFVNDGMTEEEIQNVEAQIRALDNVAAVKRTTAAQGLEEFRKNAGEDAYLFDDIPADALTDKFTITYIDNAKASSLAYSLNQIDGVRKVNSRLDLAAKMQSFKDGVMLVFMWFLIILFVVSLFVIINTIKLAVFARRQEISIMRYVGATSTFITLPFIFEGIIIGIISSVIAYFVEWYFYIYVENIMSQMSMISIMHFVDIKAYIFMGFAAIGVFTGIFGSCISLSKYLKQ
jgi:cell division transport system permease protein